jgi:putative membrane protein
MIKLISKLVLAIAVNMGALWLAAASIDGFRLETSPKNLALIAALLIALNATVRPLIKLILGPVIILTLGTGILLVNAAVLYILDIMSQNLTIETIPALVLATLLTSAVGFIYHIAIKK